MSKLPLFRSLLQRSARLGSVRFASIYEHEQHYLFHGFRSFHRHRSFFSLATSTKLAFSDCRPPFAIGIGGIRPFSEDIIRLPEIIDTDVENVFQDLLAASWDELPDPVIKDSMKALSKNTHDKAGQDALASVLRAAEACEEFGGVLVQLRMAIDDSIGMTGENVKQLADDFAHALGEVYKRYTAYLDAFGPEEMYLRKKVEIELGTKMIHLKQRCTSLGSDWGGAVTVLGTSGLSGSYVEQRTR